MNIYKTEHWPRAKNPSVNSRDSLYEIVHFYKDAKKKPRVQRKHGRMSLADAKAFCSKVETSGDVYFAGFRKAGR